MKTRKDILGYAYCVRCGAFINRGRYCAGIMCKHQRKSALRAKEVAK